MKSSEIKFEPGGFKSGTYVADTKTAGSLCLLLQVALPCVVFGSLDGSLTRIKFCGGSNATMAPQIDYFVRVFGPIVSRFGIPDYSLTLIRRGFYPQGRGIVDFSCRSLEAGQTLKPLVMDKQGDLVDVYITALSAGNEPESTAQDAAQTAKELIADAFPSVPIRLGAMVVLLQSLRQLLLVPSWLDLHWQKRAKAVTTWASMLRINSSQIFI